MKHAFGTGIEGLAGGFRHADHGDLLVGEQRRRVAFGAAGDERAKHVHAFQLIGIQRLGVAVSVVVVATVQRDQRGLEGGNRGVDLRQVDWLFRALVEGLGEQAAVGAIAVD